MIKFILDGVESSPGGRRTDDNGGFQYTFDFGGSRTRLLELAVSDLTFFTEDYTRIKNHLATKGRFVGMSMDVVYSNGDTIKYLLNFSADSYREVEGISITVPLKKFKGTDSFFDNANGVSFSRLPWQSAIDFVDVDYVIVPEAQFSYFISLSIATFALAQEIGKAVQEIQEGIADVVKATVPVGVPPAPDWGAIIVAAIKLAARIAYAIFIIIALIKLVTDIMNLIFPPIRQFKAIKLKTIIERTCEKYGLTLNSTLLNSLEPLTILPSPLRKSNPSIFEELFLPNSLAFTNGYLSPKDKVCLSPGQLIKIIEDVFNAETVIRNGELIIENEDFFLQNPTQNIPLAQNIQENITQSKGNNNSEIVKRIVIDYPTDPIDINTYDDTSDSTNEVSSEIVSSPGPLFELIKGVEYQTTTFARGTPKGGLTFVEKAAKVFATAVDFFAGTDFVTVIEGRKDVLQISSQYFTRPKWLWMIGSKIDPNQNDYIGTKKLATYHESRYIENNQRDTFEKMPWASTEEEIFAILGNKYVNLNNGTIAKLKTGSWSEETSIAELDYSILVPSVNEQTIEIDPG